MSVVEGSGSGSFVQESIMHDVNAISSNAESLVIFLIFVGFWLFDVANILKLIG